MSVFYDQQTPLGLIEIQRRYNERMSAAAQQPMPTKHDAVAIELRRWAIERVMAAGISDVDYALDVAKKLVAYVESGT